MPETIHALATPAGRGAIAVVRVSGPRAGDSLCVLSGRSLPRPRMASLRTVRWDGKAIDNALVLFFPAPDSFTGETVVEYHLHGGWSVIQSLLQALSQQPDHRPAQPGEFTRRAFEHGKLDLTEAEAVADLIDAETEAQRLQALDQLSGSLERLYDSWKNELAAQLALMEADLDFSDQDLPDDILLRVRPDVAGLLASLDEHLNDNRRGERLRNGFKIALLGAPNAGKSSLLNALAQRDVAIVSDTAGTTRDVIELHLDIGGYPVIFSDTAGLRDTDTGDAHGAIEREGIKRAKAVAENADINLLLFDATGDRDNETEELSDDRAISVLTKIDLISAPASRPQQIGISARTGAGLDLLLSAIADRLAGFAARRDAPTLTRARHRAALEKTRDALTRFQIADLPELAAEDLRLAIRHLGGITGKVDIEDLLDMIFRDFCIGK